MDRRFWFDLSEEEIVTATRPQVLERAYDYLWDDRLTQPVFYKDRLGGLVTGFRGNHYQVEIRRGPPLTATCDCGAQGLCRHAVAVLLAWREDPGRFWPLEESLAEPRDWRELFATAVFRPERLWLYRSEPGFSETARERFRRRPRPDCLAKLLASYRWGPLPDDPEADRELFAAAREAGAGPFPWSDLRPLWEAWLLGDFGHQEELSALLLSWAGPAERQRLDNFLRGHLHLLEAEAGQTPGAADRYRAGRLMDTLVLLRRSEGRPHGLRRLLYRYRWAWGAPERTERFVAEEGAPRKSIPPLGKEI